MEVIIRYSIFITLLLIPFWLHAESRTGNQIVSIIEVVDQEGVILSNAVISLQEGEISSIPSEAAIMDQVNLQFKPLVLVVKKGRKVVFPNSDNIRHHVYSFSDPKRFEIKLYEGVPKQPLIFDQAGIVILGCNIHDSMTGYIYVSDTPYFWKTDSAGIASLNSLGTPPETVRIWHPWSDQGILPLDVKLSNYKVSSTETIIRYRVTLNVTHPVQLKTFKRRKRDYF